MSEFRRRCLLQAMKYGKGDMVIEVSKPTTFTITENGVERVVALSTGINRLPHLDKVDKITWKTRDDAILSFDGGGVYVDNCSGLFDSLPNLRSIRNFDYNEKNERIEFINCFSLEYIERVRYGNLMNWRGFFQNYKLKFVGLHYQPANWRSVDLRNCSELTEECIDYIYHHMDAEPVTALYRGSQINLHPIAYDKFGKKNKERFNKYGVDIIRQE